jgi:hypothetical protein
MESNIPTIIVEEIETDVPAKSIKSKATKKTKNQINNNLSEENLIEDSTKKASPSVPKSKMAKKTKKQVNDDMPMNTANEEIANQSLTSTTSKQIKQKNAVIDSSDDNDQTLTTNGQLLNVNRTEQLIEGMLLKVKSNVPKEKEAKKKTEKHINKDSAMNETDTLIKMSKKPNNVESKELESEEKEVDTLYNDDKNRTWAEQMMLMCGAKPLKEDSVNNKLDIPSTSKEDSEIKKPNVLSQKNNVIANEIEKPKDDSFENDDNLTWAKQALNEAKKSTSKVDNKKQINKDTFYNDDDLDWAAQLLVVKETNVPLTSKTDRQDPFYNDDDLDWAAQLANEKGQIKEAKDDKGWFFMIFYRQL